MRRIQKQIKEVVVVVRRILIPTLILVLSFSSSYGNTLDEKLSILEPLVNKKWVGEIETPSKDARFKIFRQFEVVWGGNSVDFTTGCKELNKIRATWMFMHEEA